MSANYYSFDRDTWTSFNEVEASPLSIEELNHIKSFNDRISLEDVQEIYMPLTRLLEIYITNYQSLQLSRALFMKKSTPNVPFMIGIAGSVAVGKSTTARLLQRLLRHRFPNKKTQLITTDGFLYPKDILEKKGILDKKGFPESYDMPALMTFFNQVKSGQPSIAVPIYSHETYDIIKDKYDYITQPDILIVEGINVLQMNQHMYISDFFDFSIYVDADESLIQQWYLDRFNALLDVAATDPNAYYHKQAIGPRSSAMQMALHIWQTVNQPNLTQFILPTRHRADLILHKTSQHKIDQVLLRRY